VLIDARDLLGFAIEAVDGEVGLIHDLQIDDRRWVVRDIVADVGHWLTGRMALIDPAVVVRADCTRRTLHVALTAEQIAEAPGIESHPSVARQRRVEPYNYLGMPACWGAEDRRPWASTALDTSSSRRQSPRRVDPRLRSLRELSHYWLVAHDGEAGHVKDWLVDAQGWVTRYAVVRVTGGWTGKDVLVPVQWLGPISYGARVVYADLNRRTVIHAPDFDAVAVMDADYERRLLGWYEQPTRRAEAVSWH
jgi:hypothetical protein